LTTRFDRFQAELKDEIAYLKKQNSEQVEEIRRLKEAAENKEDTTTSSGEKEINHKPNDSSPRVLPSSCRQLETLGHTLNGFYIVQNIIDSKMKVVYCDFQPGILIAHFNNFTSHRIFIEFRHYLATNITQFLRHELAILTSKRVRFTSTFNGRHHFP